MERIRVETEQRIARRRELLEQELQEYDAAIELEIERVQKRIAAFEGEVTQFFEQLLQEADPTVFASMAAQMPDPPTFSVRERSGVTADLRARREQIMRPAAATTVESPTGANGTQPADADGGEAAATSVATTRAVPKTATVESTQVVVVGLLSVDFIAV